MLWTSTVGLLNYILHQYISTGQSLFFLLYGQDAQLLTALNFFALTIPCLTIEMDYVWELLQEQRRAREVAKKNI